MPVITITLIAIVFLGKLGNMLSIPNSLHLNALNNALNANIPNKTVSISLANPIFSVDAPKILNFICTNKIDVTYMAFKTIDIIIVFVIILEFLSTGFLLNTLFLIGSNPRTSAGGPSIIILIHNN